MQPIDPLQEFLKIVQSFADKEWPGHRDNLRRALPGVEIPTRILVPGLVEEAKPGGNQGPDKGEILLANAASKRGLPYQWGGVGNPSYDCSGLVQWAASTVGVHVGRTTYDQIKNGMEVPFGDVRIGDLVFSRFSAPGVPEHVSIWAGNGKVFEAGDPLGYYNWGNRGTVRVRRIV